MEANDQNNISSNDRCDGIDPISLDSPTSYSADFPIETYSALISNSGTADGTVAQNAYQGYKDSPSRTFNGNHTSEERKMRKQRFWMTVRVLMRYLKKKDSDLYKRARNALGECAKRHVMRDKGYSNVLKCVHRELKMIVGVRYWERADRHVTDHLAKKANASKRIEEEKLRKKTFWMQVRVLMRYLKKKDLQLYNLARRTLEDCEKRYVMKEERFANLVESVERGLTHVVGTRYWKRVERHVAKHLHETSHQATVIEEAPSFDSQEDPTSRLVPHNTKRPSGPCPLKAAFSPPRKTNTANNP